jgi:hypothetical protein
MRGAYATSYSKFIQYSRPPLVLLSVRGDRVCERLSVEKPLRVLAGYFNVKQKSENVTGWCCDVSDSKKWWRHLVGIAGAYSEEESR